MSERKKIIKATRMLKKLFAKHCFLGFLLLLAMASTALYAAKPASNAKFTLTEAHRQKYVFKHPGLMLGRVELDLIKSEVNNTDATPSESVRLRKLSWEEMMKTKAILYPKDEKLRLLSDLDYPPHAREQLVADGGVSENFSTDSWAAYCHALQWYVKGDHRNADKAIGILNAWAGTLRKVSSASVYKGRQEQLAISWITQRLCEAAEILRYSHSGWKKEDIRKFETMLTGVLLPIINHQCPENGNWEASTINALLAMGVFCNDEATFNLGIDFFHGTGNAALEKYVFPSGQSAETLRDFGHAQMGIADLVDACEIAWHQGVDLYGELPDPQSGLPRLAKAIEYIATIENGNEVTGINNWGAYGEKGKEVRIKAVDGKNWAAGAENGFSKMIQPVYEVPWNHYANRMGFGAKMPNVQELLNSQNIWWLGSTPGKAYRPEPFRENGQFGWGTLTHSNLSKPEKGRGNHKLSR